jgi:indole-3-glycerol phosphate synthase
MAENILNRIIKKKIKKVDLLKKSISLKFLNEKISENKLFVDFKQKIQNNINDDKFSIIAEIKKASPSAGVIVKEYDPVKIAKIYYKNNVTCLSILTEEDFFLGNLTDLNKVKKKSTYLFFVKIFL